MFRKYLLFVVLVTGACTVYAQSSTSTAPRPTAEQQRHNQQMVQAALQVAQLVDQNQIAQVWDGASTVTKQIVNRDTFIQSVDADRKMVGVPEARNLTSLTYSQSDGRKLPPGLFANVAFATHFANEKQLVRELVSFHLDNDQVWRVSGYTLR